PGAPAPPSASPQAADTTAPAAAPLTINSGAASTNATVVTLALAATDAVGVTGYYLSTSSTPPAASAAGWTTVTPNTSYVGSPSYTLASGDGSNTVCAYSKDAATSGSPTSSSAILQDQTPPTHATRTPTAPRAQTI